MQNCLRGVAPGSSLNTIWASSWNTSTYLPTLWANDEFMQGWSFVGGINRCGGLLQVESLFSGVVRTTYCPLW
jgi:hypothetical protein